MSNAWEVDYTSWCNHEADKIASELYARAQAGDCSGLAVYVVPANGEAWGYLVLAEVSPMSHGDKPKPCPVLRFPVVGSRVYLVPYGDLRSLIWDGCHSEPVLGTAAVAVAKAPRPPESA